MNKDHFLVSFKKQPLWQWLLYLLAWTGAIAIGYILISNAMLEESAPRRIHVLLVRWTATLYLFGLAVPAIAVLAHKFPLEAGAWQRRLVLHLLAAILFTVAFEIAIERLTLLYLKTVAGPMAMRQPNFTLRTQMNREGGFGYLYFLIRFFAPTFLSYWVVLSLSQMVGSYRKLRERELQTSQLQSQLARAQLQALKNQLHPHFLFNTLHTLSSLVYQDARAADKMIRQLSDLLRMAMANADVQEVTLREELDFLDIYLEIMATRYRDRFEVHRDIASETLDALMPNLILQLLVENAIKHGIEKTAGKGTIHICTKKDGQKLVVEISDNGPGLAGSLEQAMQKGMGLRNTVTRMQQLYGENQHLRFESLPENGLKISLAVPFHTQQNQAV